MCGIMAYSGHRPAVALTVEGLRRLEYRGYDSAGLAFAQGGALHVQRAEGKLVALEEKLACQPGFLATTALGHTRWATHGAPVERNAHPHCSNNGQIAIIHNGIIENYLEIKAELAGQGFSFVSDTDTEVLACLIEYERRASKGVQEAFSKALRRVRGSFAVVLLSLEEPQVLYGARLSAPLLLGIGTGESFIASDIPAFLAHTRHVVFLDDGEIARIEQQKWQVFTLADGKEITKEVHTIAWDMQAAQKDGYKHFMLKEILEQPKVVNDCMVGRVKGQSVSLPELDALPVPSRLRIVACGTSYHAGLWGAMMLERWAEIPVQVEIASEFRYRKPLLSAGEQVLLISQSGETADTLGALRLAKEMSYSTLGICNVVGSSLDREAQAVLHTQAGPEISVASTKALCSQMVLLLLMALYYRHRQGKNMPQDLLKALHSLPEILAEALPAMRAKASALAPVYAAARSFFFLGRGACYPLALEGALKLKELSYIHAEGYAAGEMKHGPIALIDAEFPTFAMALDDDVLEKTWSNIVEVQARRGKVVALMNRESTGMQVDHPWIVPHVHSGLGAFLALPALQLFSYEVADFLGKDVDQPRNLAKSVTVE